MKTYKVWLQVNGEAKVVKTECSGDTIISSAMCGLFDRKASELVDEDFLRRVFSTRYSVLYVEKS